MAAPIERALMLGFRFEPKPEDAIGYYLPRLLAGERMHATIAPFIHRTDIYATEPGVLAAQFRPTPKAEDRFFFTSCRRQGGKSGRAVRVAGSGSWHSQGHATDVKNEEGFKIGEMKKLRYKKGGKFTDWLMDEFSSCAANTIDGDKQFVLCKMYVSPRAGPESAARQESAAFAAAVAPPPPPAPVEQEPVAAAPKNNSKRPAPPVAEPLRTTKRVRAPPPVVPPPLPSTVQAPCSTIAVPDPFCTDTDSSAQDDDGLDSALDIDFDVDYIRSHENNLWTGRADEEEPAHAQDDDLDFAKKLEDSLEIGDQAEEETPAQAQDGVNDDLEFAHMLEDSLETE